MARKSVYILVTKLGPSADQQRALIRKTVKLISRDEEYLDDLTEPYRRKDKPLEERAVALKQLRAGDMLIVATPGCIGVGRDDVRTVLLQLARSDNGLLDASTGNVVRWTAEVADAVEFLDRATLERKRGAAENARQAKIALGYVHIQEEKPLLVTEDHAKMMWRDRVAYPSKEEVAKRCGVSVRTMYGRFGARDQKQALQRKRRS